MIKPTKQEKNELQKQLNNIILYTTKLLTYRQNLSLFDIDYLQKITRANKQLSYLYNIKYEIMQKLK